MARVLVLGVNPFEDLPGYQLLGLLKRGEHEVVAADDSSVAIAILKRLGTRIEMLPHPSEDPQMFTALVGALCREHRIDVLLPGTDAHLYALASCLGDDPDLALRCPSLTWLHAASLFTKPMLQSWLTKAGATPERWTFDDEDDASRFADESRYPIVVKGFRKGAVKCDDPLEATVARRAILRNPANQGPGGGVYAEAFIDGEEHSLFVLCGAHGERLVTFGFRKLATTQLGTTVAAVVEDSPPSGTMLEALLADVTGPTAFEIEWRRDGAAREWLFEVNVRFPSWIGSLAAYGSAVLEDYIQRVLDPGAAARSSLPAPINGTIFYRVPQSGFLSVEETFGSPPFGKAQGAASTGKMLWRSTAPHMFRAK
ncbi:MAG TPA: hypothetical protein VK669_14270 [Candidatus Limnocylindrales bacterium]|nr:hypothetical protein [Candidatus Limnocylindrales bacterium]